MFLTFLKRLFSRSRPAPRALAPTAARPQAAPRPSRDEAQSNEEREPLAKPAHAELLDVLDGKAHFRETLNGREEAVLLAVGRRVEEGDLVLPVLPTTSVAAMDMASRPSAEVGDVVRLIAGDPVLTSELLKISNSVLYAGSQKCETLREAVMRIGLRALRSMIFSISMRAVLLRDKTLAHMAEELWRQAHSVSLMARNLAPILGMDKERAFLIGLLHDIGKVALLETVRQEGSDLELRPALLGRAFYLHHERAGERLARAWKLPDELVSIAGCHHRFDRNAEHGRSAALASLAHALDLGLTIGGRERAAEMLTLPEFDYLGVAPENRQRILDIALGTFGGERAVAA